jgi:rubredoxin
MNKLRRQVCGYVLEGEQPPEKCAVCGADGKLYAEFLEEGAPQPEAAASEPADVEPVEKKWRCTICGYKHQGAEPPDMCPVCGSDKSVFEEVGEDIPAAGVGPKDMPPPEKIPPVAAPGKDDPGLRPAFTPGGLYQRIVQQMLKHHAHPISVHIPNGVLPVSVVFIVIAALSGFKFLQIAAMCNMVFVVITIPFVIFSGYIEWRNRYQGARTGRFITKMILAGIVAATCVIVVLWWLAVPDVLESALPQRLAFIAVNAVMLAAAAMAGFIGGKLVFKD